MALVIYEHLIDVHFPYDFITIPYEDQDDYSTFPNPNSNNNIMVSLYRNTKLHHCYTLSSSCGIRLAAKSSLIPSVALQFKT